MTVEEARNLIGIKKEITIKRHHAKWTGIPTGVFTRPAIRLEQPSNGQVVVIVLDDAEVVNENP